MKHFQAGLILFLALISLFALGTIHGSGDLLGSTFCDMPSTYLPLRTFGFENLAHGKIPFWNPYVFCGNPFAANPETALFYPPNLIFLVLPIDKALNASIIFHLWLTGFFTWFLMRHWRVGGFPALLAAVAFMLGGNVLQRVFAGHLSNLCTMAWLPLLVLILERIPTSNPRPLLAFGGLIYALMILGGHLQYVFYFSLFLGGFGLVRAIQNGYVIRFACSLCLMFLLGIGLSGIQFSLTLEMVKESARQAASYEFCSTFSWDPMFLVTIFLPHFFWTNNCGYWGTTSPWEMNTYFGIPVLFLALFGCIVCLRPKTLSREIPPTLQGFSSLGRALLLCGFAAVILALGKFTPLFPLLFNHVPGFNLFRGLCKFLIPAFLLFSCLAGVGLHLYINPCPAGKSRGAMVALSILGLILITLPLLTIPFTINNGQLWEETVKSILVSDSNFSVFPDIAAEKYRPGILRGFSSELYRSLAFTILTGILALNLLPGRRFVKTTALIFLAFAVFDISLGNAPFLTRCDSQQWKSTDRPKGIEPQLQRVSVHISAGNPNQGLLDKSRNVLGWESNSPMVHSQLMNALKGLPFEEFSRTDFSHYPRTLAITAMHSLKTKQGFKELPEPLPRFSLLSQAKICPTNREVWNIIASQAFNPLQELLVAPSIQGDVPPEIVSSPATHTLSIMSDLPESQEFKITAGSAVWLSVADTLTQGWSATLDGKPVPIFRGNYAFRGIPIPPGEHVVSIVYDPPGWIRGVATTLVSLGIVLFLLFWPTPKNLKTLET